MAPSRNSPTKSKASVAATKGLTSPAAASTAPILPSTMAKSPTELAGIFKTELDNVRGLVTCSICDQLLYEPWTLACGHTYCYSCLCNWFLPNKRSKSCPECRSSVRDIPAPAFVIKQLVDIFVNRVELMPVDESLEQHDRKKKEENEHVEADKSAEDGLFKGCFNNTRPEHLQYDQADLIYRCTHCGHEYTGGQRCSNCDADFEGDENEIGTGLEEFSDLEDIEFDVDDVDDDVDIVDEDAGDYYEDMQPDYDDLDAPHNLTMRRRPDILEDQPVSRDMVARGFVREEASSDESDGESEGAETTSSMRDFIDDDVDDEGSTSPMIQRNAQRQQEHRSDGENSDEGGEVSSMRQRPRERRRPGPPIVLDSESEGEDANSMHSHESYPGYGMQLDGIISNVFRNGGWSPLDHGDDSEEGEDGEDASSAVYDRQCSVASGDSGTDTTVGHRESEDEEDEDEEEREESDDEGDDEGGDEEGFLRTRDRSPTPRLSLAPNPLRRPWEAYRARNMGRAGQRLNERNSRHAGRRRERKERENERAYAAYESSEDDEDPNADRDVGMSTHRPTARGRANGRAVQHLGDAHEVHDVDESSSDTSVQPPSRRQRPRVIAERTSNPPHFDPRISRLLAQHQSNLRFIRAREHPFSLERRREGASASLMEPFARSRRRVQYAVDPPHLAHTTRLPHEMLTTSSPFRSHRGYRQHRDYLF